MEKPDAEAIPPRKKRRADMTPNERTRDRLDAAKRRRNDLVRVLSPECKCDSCGEVFEPDELEIDHIDGRDWHPRKLSPQMRAARYWREHKAGVRLRVLCKSCNSSDGATRRYGYER